MTTDYPGAPTADQVLEHLRTHVRIDPDTGCRIWAGGTTREGYPVVGWQYRKHSARRLMMQLLGRQVTSKQFVWTSCGQKNCLAEDHLRVGSKRQAAAASAKRGAYVTGSQRSLMTALSRVKDARLSIADRHDVWAMICAGDSHRVIGERYGVTASAVGHAMRAWQRALGPAAYWIRPREVRHAA
jgi:hypothetical protein